METFEYLSAFLLFEGAYIRNRIWIRNPLLSLPATDPLLALSSSAGPDPYLFLGVECQAFNKNWRNNDDGGLK